MARDRTCILMDASQIRFHWGTTGTPEPWQELQIFKYNRFLKPFKWSIADIQKSIDHRFIAQWAFTKWIHLIWAPPKSKNRTGSARKKSPTGSHQWLFPLFSPKVTTLNLQHHRLILFVFGPHVNRIIHYVFFFQVWSLRLYLKAFHVFVYNGCSFAFIAV